MGNFDQRAPFAVPRLGVPMSLAQPSGTTGSTTILVFTRTGVGGTDHVWFYDVQADGTLVGGRVFFDGIGTGVIEEGIADGMKCDERGNIWVTGPRGVWVISPQGEHLGVIEVPENVGNISWGGAGWKTLYMPSSTSLYRVQTRVASAPLPYH